jgi:NAD(P)-dependent dehydrogenase (short-subunit alcohol dehydrogenase family)
MSLTPEERAGIAGLDCSGIQVLLTGSTSGIGRASALALGRLGADVIVHGRDADAGARVVDELDAIGAEARFLAADFADSEAVRDLAATMLSEYPSGTEAIRTRRVRPTFPVVGVP